MRSSGEHVSTTDSDEFCRECDTDYTVDLHRNKATGIAFWECERGHGHEREID